MHDASKAGSGQEKSAFSVFARSSGRQSLASNNSNMQRWFEAQERQEEIFYQQQVPTDNYQWLD